MKNSRIEKKKIDRMILKLEDMHNLIFFENDKDLASQNIIYYVERIKAIIAKKNWTSNIKIETKKCPVSCDEFGIQGIDGYFLKFENCEIIVSEKENKSHHHIFEVGYSGPHILRDKIYFSYTLPIFLFHFENCKITHSDTNTQASIIFTLKSGCSIRFTSNEITNIYLLFKFHGQNTQTIELGQNNFSNSTLNIHGTTNKISESPDSNLTKNVDIKEYQSGWFKPFILLNNNKFDTIKLCGYHKIEFSGQNKINLLEAQMPYPQIIWGPYQKILSNKLARIDAHKELFLILKNTAEEKRDTFQVEYFRVEIAKCEHERIQYEESSISFQDRFILRYSQLASNYGTSWIKPILWLFTVNFLFAIFLLFFKTNCNDIGCFIDGLFQKTFNLFIPFSMIDASINTSGDSKALYSALNVLHKALYASLVYETVKSFRRFARK